MCANALRVTNLFRWSETTSNIGTNKIVNRKKILNVHLGNERGCAFATRRKDKQCVGLKTGKYSTLAPCSAPLAELSRDVENCRTQDRPDRMRNYFEKVVHCLISPKKWEGL